MGRLLAALLTAALTAGLLTGCGDTDGGLRPDPGADDPPTGQAEPTEPTEPTVVGVVSGSAAAGQLSRRPVPVSEPKQLADFVDQFDAGLDELVTRRAERAEVPEGQTLYAAVVAIGCEPPEDVDVRMKGDRLRILPVPRKPTGKVQCLVAITTVALVTA